MFTVMCCCVIDRGQRELKELEFCSINFVFCRQAVSLHPREMALKNEGRLFARFSKRQKGLSYISFET